MRTAIYARVSTTDQDCELQLRELRAYCAARGFEVTGEYVDTGFSGAKASRPQLDRMVAEYRKRALDCVVVWKLDRLGRSLKNVIELVQEMAALNVRFICVTQGIDTDCNNPGSRLFLHLLAAFAEFERELARERTVAGLRVAVERGKVLGRPRRVFRRDEAVRMRKEGISWKKIAAALGVPATTIREALAEAE